MRDVLVESSVLVALDFEEEPGCEFRGAASGNMPIAPPGCDRAAVWAGQASCCRAIEFFCDEHRALVEPLCAGPLPNNARHILCRSRGFVRAWSPVGGSCA